MYGKGPFLSKSKKTIETRPTDITYLLITMHGRYDVDSKESIISDGIEDLDVRKINATKIGVFNFICDYNVNEIFEIYKDFIETEESDDLDVISNNLSNLLRENDYQHKNLSAEEKNFEKGSIDHKDYRKYSVAVDKSYEVYTINKDNPEYYNKIFGFSRRDIDVSPFNSSIVVMDSHYPDIKFNISERLYHEPVEVTLKQLLEYLNEIGRKKIVIVDLSCSSSEDLKESTMRSMSYMSNRKIGRGKKSVKKKNKIDKYVGKVVLINLPNNVRPQYRWIVKKRHDGRYIARAPKVGVLLKNLHKKSKNDFNSEHLLPKNFMFYKTLNNRRKTIKKKFKNTT